jgi:hypothetical protein
MALSLEQSSNITAQFGNATYANSGAASTNISTSAATTFAIKGLAYNAAIQAAAAAPTTDFNSKTPPAILGAQAAVVVIGFNASGALQFLQGPVQSYTNQVALSALLPLPAIPDGFCPIAYQVVKNKNTTGTAGWTFGTSLFNASNVSFETAVQVAQLPSAGVYNQSA